MRRLGSGLVVPLLHSGPLESHAGRMAKYDPLQEYLARQSANVSIDMSFDEIAAIVGGLPASATRYQAWWANERNGRHVQAHAWLGAHRKVESVDIPSQWVRFSAVTDAER